MGLPLISYGNLADAATLSGGSWAGALPLANLQDRIQGKVARSTDAAATSTLIDVDLADASKIVRLVGLVRHTCSILATYRITAGTSSGGAEVYDSGTLDVWPAVYSPSDLEWEDDNWWLGTISAEDALAYPVSLWHDTAINSKARYWRIQITDTANPAGYVQAARLWMGRAVSPSIGPRFGAGLTWEARSEEERSLGGTLYFDERPSARVYSFELGALTNDEAMGWALDLQRIAGNSGEVVIIPDPDDAQSRIKRDILGRLRAMDPLTQFSHGYQSTGFTVEELL